MTKLRKFIIIFVALISLLADGIQIATFTKDYLGEGAKPLHELSAPVPADQHLAG